MAVNEHSSQRVLRLATALILNEKGQTLLVRKAGTQAFMQAGGKIAHGEKPLDALLRELEEELDLKITYDDARFLGVFCASAANEPEYTLEAQCYLVTCTQELHPQAEISEIVWVTPSEAENLPLAPLTRDSILPLARSYIDA